MRLTYKLEKPIDTKYLHYDYLIIADYDISRGNYGRITDSEIYNKLGQLEDIEDELGIELLTLLKARNGFYAYDEEYDKIIFYKDDLWINIESEMLGGSKLIKIEGNVHFISHSQCEFKDYGKTWALTKEELL